MKTTCRIISIGALTLAVAGAVGLGILSQRDLLAQTSGSEDGEWGEWSCAKYTPPENEHMPWVNLKCQRSKTYRDRRGELVCTVSGHDRKLCNTNTGRCSDRGWSTDNEDCTIWIEEEEPEEIPCAPGLAQCCMTAGGYSGKISPCTNPGATYEPKCEAVCEPVHGPCIERPGGNGAICSAPYSNGGDSGVEPALFAAQRHNDIAAAELAAAQEAANDAKDALNEAKDAYAEAKSAKTESKQEASAAKSAFKGADSGEKVDAMAEMLTAQSTYAEAVQAVTDSKAAYAAAKNTYTKVKAAVSNAKRTFKKEAAELKAAKKAAQ